MNENLTENINEEEIKEMQEYFDKEVWSNMKKEVKEMTKKESCFFAFFTGSEMMKQVNKMQHEELGKELEEMQEKIKGMSDEEKLKLLEGKEKEEDGLWENKTNVNGVWVNDKTGEEVKDEG